MNKSKLHSKLDNFLPIINEDFKDFFELEAIVNEIFTKKIENEFLIDFLKIFERFPLENNEYFWSILHGIEQIKNFEKELVKSVLFQPSLFGLLMINRLMNDSIQNIEETNLIDIFKKHMHNQQLANELKEEAVSFYNYQTNKKNEIKT